MSDLLKWTFLVGLPIVAPLRGRTVTVRAATYNEACLLAREALDRRAKKRGVEPPVAWQIHLMSKETVRKPRSRSMKTDTDRAISYAIKTFGREPPRGADVEEVLAMLVEVRREEEQKLAGHEHPPGQTNARNDEMRAVSYVCRRMPKAFPNGWLVDDLVSVFRTVRRDARRKFQQQEKERAA